MAFLEEYWKNEIQIYCFELRASKKEVDNACAERYFGVWYEKLEVKKLVYKLLHLWMERCKTMHALGYF
jgi:hypothetical protein